MARFVRQKTHLLISFRHALRGIRFVLFSQRNMWIHVSVAFVALCLGWFLKITTIEWMYLIFSIFLVLIAETFNTSIEVLVDLVTRQRRVRAMFSKDIAAGAVLMAAVHAVIAGYFIFFERIVTLWSS